MGAPNTTPGPWRVRYHCDGKVLDHIQGAPSPGCQYGRSVTVYRGLARPASAETRANAHQIAASGDLYDLCAEALDFLGGVDGAVGLRARLLVGLAKAEGR